MCVCGGVCVCVDRMNLKYALRWHIHISVPSIHTHTHILKPFADSEPLGLKVDIVGRLVTMMMMVMMMMMMCGVKGGVCKVGEPGHVLLCAVSHVVGH